MKYLTPQSIAEITGGKYVGDERSRSVRVEGAVRDNRDVKAGNLFVCIRGARVDGHTFANSAYEAGASCCLAERAIPDPKGPYVLVESTLSAIKTLAAHYRRLFGIPIVGVTGSVGKTSAKEMIAAVLGERFRVLKTDGNLNNELGVPLTLLSLGEPHEAAVIEMGISDFGEMGRLAEMVRPDICVITKIGYSHLENLGDLNGVLRAKSEVFAHMGRDGIAVLNGDDALLSKYDPGIRKITFGLDPCNNYRAENILEEDTDGITCDIVSESGRFKGKIPAYGRHLVMAALASAAAGRLLGMADDDIRRGLLSYAPVGGRSNVISTGYIKLIDDCYNANPDSLRAALESFGNLQGRRVAILGDMLELGRQSEALHREIGAFAWQKKIDGLICSGEKAALICEGYVSSGGKMARHFPAKTDLISALPSIVEKGDNVLVKASHGMRFDEIADWLKKIQCYPH